MSQPGGWWGELRRAVEGNRWLKPLGRRVRALWSGKKAARGPVDPVEVELPRLQSLVDDFARKDMTVAYVVRRGSERWRIAPGGTESLACEEGLPEPSPLMQKLLAQLKQQSSESELVPGTSARTDDIDVSVEEAPAKQIDELLDGVPEPSETASVPPRGWIAAWQRWALGRSNAPSERAGSRKRVG